MPSLIARLRISPRALLSALIVVLLGAVLVLTIRATVGITASLAAYASALLLLAPVRRAPLAWQWAVALWTFAVALGGYLIGGFGIWAILLGLILVSIGQSAFGFDQAGGITRSPVNFLVFAGMGTSSAPLWEIIVGTAIGIVFMMLCMIFLRRGAATIDSGSHDTFRDRLTAGLLLALGCVTIVGIGELLGFARVPWALLSLCMIIAVDTAARAGRSWERVAGTIVGALAATLIAQLPDPAVVVIAAVCAVLCVAYLRAGDYTLFMVFLTPAVLLTAGGAASYILAIERIIAVLFAAAVALALTWVDRMLTRLR